MKKLILSSLLIIATTIISCNDDEGNISSESETAIFTVSIENIAPEKTFVKSGVFNIPVDNLGPGAATPGNRFEFIIDAGRSHNLSFATMLAATNDLFFAPDEEGIALYDGNGHPISGDVTNQIYLWDAGTELNEEPAVGPNTVTNQTARNTGEDENGTVRKIEDIDTDTFDYPPVNEIVNVSIAHAGGTRFKVTIEDLSTALLKTSEGERPAPISPGVWVVYNSNVPNPLFIENQHDLGQGIESIAEDGNPDILGEHVLGNTGVTYPASPGGWIVHQQGTKPFFTEGLDDYNDGIEAIAEDGSAVNLEMALSSLSGFKDGDIFDTPVGNSVPGAILPGNQFQFSFEASIGDQLSLATMLAATNDIFFGTADTGIPLFNTNGEPIGGDITNQVYLWDAGTEVNEEPAIGPNTVTNQLAPNTGTDQDEPVYLLNDVNDGFDYPTVNNVLKVTISVN